MNNDSIFIDKMACPECCCCCCHLKIFSRNACDIEWNISNRIMLVTWFPVNVHKQVILSQIHVFTHDQHFLFLASDTYSNVYKFQFDAREKFNSNTNSINWFIKFPRNLFISFKRDKKNTKNQSQKQIQKMWQPLQTNNVQSNVNLLVSPDTWAINMNQSFVVSIETRGYCIYRKTDDDDDYYCKNYEIYKNQTLLHLRSY